MQKYLSLREEEPIQPEMSGKVTLRVEEQSDDSSSNESPKQNFKFNCLD
jgi:hypothetical protein